MIGVGAGRAAAAPTRSSDSRVTYPFENDPNGVIAHMGVEPKPTHWKVGVCDHGTGYRLANPQTAIDAWGGQVTGWFVWASGGAYTPQFEATNISVKGKTPKACVDAATKELTSADKSAGVGIIILANQKPNQNDISRDEGSLGIANTASLTPRNNHGPSATITTDNTTPSVHMTGSAVEHSRSWALYVHEMAHTLGLHHVPYRHSKNTYSAAGDVMGGIRRVGTHAINRYRLGWVDPSRLITHTNPNQTVEIGYPHSGLPEVVVIAEPGRPGAFWAIGVNPGNTYPSFDDVESRAVSGIDVMWVDQTPTSHHATFGYGYRYCAAPGTNRTRAGAICTMLAVETSMLVPTSVADYEEFAWQPGQHFTVGGVKVEVLAQTTHGYQLKLNGEPTPMWGRHYKLTPPGGSHYADVPSGHLFADEINNIAEAGITTGCNPPANDQYCPERNITRGELAVMLSRLLNLEPATRDHFEDDNGAYYEDAVNRLAEAGITKGCNPPANTSYCGNRHLTRGEAASFFVRALQLPQTATRKFTDTTDRFYIQDAEALAAAGITRGCNPPQNTHYCGERHITRGEAAAYIWRARQHLGR